MVSSLGFPRVFFFGCCFFFRFSLLSFPPGRPVASCGVPVEGSADFRPGTMRWRPWRPWARNCFWPLWSPPETCSLKEEHPGPRKLESMLDRVRTSHFEFDCMYRVYIPILDLLSWERTRTVDGEDPDWFISFLKIGNKQPR